MEISNKYLTAKFKKSGAELFSLQYEGLEYLWQGDPYFWSRHAPVLFPFVGRLKDNCYSYDGNTYEMGQHGFARNMDFKVMNKKKSEIAFELTANDETRSVYPFDFRLMIVYRLIDKTLTTHYAVTNQGATEMFFSIGGHPGFCCPFTEDEVRSDYWLQFEMEEPLLTHRLNSKGLFSGERETIYLQENKLYIDHSLFDKDALIFKDLKSTSVSLVSEMKNWLTFTFKGFPYLGLWSKNKESPFVCIEPWFGLADHASHNGNIRDKEGIRVLAPSETFQCHYFIEIH